MKIFVALAIMLAAFTMGLMAIGIVMAIMGLAGAPGAILYDAGKKMRSGFLAACGFVIAALGQSYIAGAYSVFVIALLRWFTESRPDIPTWPLWIAAFFHSGAAPTYGMKERPEQPTAQHHTLGIVALLATTVFFTATFAPNVLKPIYGWVPLYSRMLQQQNSLDAEQKNLILDHTDLFTKKQKESIEGFFDGYEYLKNIMILVKGIQNTQDAREDLNNIESLINKALERLDICDPTLLNGIQPGWGDNTKEKFIPALKKMKTGIKFDGDRNELTKSDLLIQDFDSWLRVNWNEICAKCNASS